jgi:hypothetical protein
MTSERDRLIGLIDYVAATERDRLRVVLDVADHRGFRRTGEEILKLPGVVLNDRSETDHVWLSVDRLARRAPPSPTNLELKLWAKIPDDVDVAPSLVAELPRATLADAKLVDPAGPQDAAAVRLADYPHRERLEQALAAYTRELWRGWVLDERPRRQSIALYNALFALRQALEGAGETPVELVWGIGPASWTRPMGRLRYPLLTVAMELAIDERTHAIALRPRTEAPAGIESDPLDALDAPGVAEWRRFAQAQLDAGEGDGLSPFAPDSFAPILRRAVALLDADGHYLPELGDRPAPGGDGLQVGGGWVVFERVRRATMLMDDLRRFRSSIEAATADQDIISPAVRAMLSDPAEAVAAEAYPTYRGVSTVPGVTSSDGSGADLFFPKPFNREQVEVIQRLSVRPGVVVQGPPGTGKTHTIANIISHYLALGKRVLVTSQKAAALKVLRHQLPPAVRPLAVSLLESDRDGLKQFQDSVDIIAERLQRIRPAEATREIAALDQRIEALHRGLAEIDRAVDTIGRTAIGSVEIDGARLAPATGRARADGLARLASWLPDALDTIRSHDPEFGDADIVAIRAARKAAGARLAYRTVAIPPPGTLPDGEAFAALHADLAEAETIRRSAQGEAALGVDATPELLDRSRAALAALEAARTAIAREGAAWGDAFLGDLRRGRSDDAIVALEGLGDRIDAACTEARHFLVRPVTLPEGALHDTGLRQMIAELAGGGEPSFFQGLFARGLKLRLAEIRLTGRPPQGAEQWAEVDRHLSALEEAQALTAAWNHAAGPSAWKRCRSTACPPPPPCARARPRRRPAPPSRAGARRRCADRSPAAGLPPQRGRRSRRDCRRRRASRKPQPPRPPACGRGAPRSAAGASGACGGRRRGRPARPDRPRRRPRGRWCRIARRLARARCRGRRDRGARPSLRDDRSGLRRGRGKRRAALGRAAARRSGARGRGPVDPGRLAAALAVAAARRLADPDRPPRRAARPPPAPHRSRASAAPRL